MTPPPAAAAAEALPRHRTAPVRAPARHPRRISGPGRPAARPPARPGARPATRPSGRTADRSVPRVPARPAARAVSRPAEGAGLAVRAIGLYERVCDSVLLDRLVRGRLWIGLLAFSLIGLVAMQLLVLRLNNGIGATLERAAALQRANAQLGIEAATGTGEGRVAPLAAATGMVFAPPGSVHFVASSPTSDVSRAAAVLAAPIQPHEYVASGAEQAPVGSTEAGSGEASSASGEATGAGEAAGAGEATSSGEGASGPSGASVPVGAGAAGGSAEASSSAQARGAEASAAAAQPEASASAAGGVAAG